MIATDNMYQWDGMSKISKSAALKHHSQGCQVYLLYSDNTESAAHSIKDILTHAKKGGLFGIEKSVDT